MNVAESMVASWLRHEKCCQLVQCNLRCSPKWSRDSEGEVAIWCKGLKNELSNGVGADGTKVYKIFKGGQHRNGVNVSNVLKQMEIDVFGYDFKDNKVWACEVAYHKGGCLYGRSTKSTVEKILEKLIRAYVFWKVCIKQGTSLNLVFVTPFISDKCAECLKEIVKVARAKLQEINAPVSIQLILGDDVVDQITNKILELENESGIDDIFVRTAGLLHGNINKPVKKL